MWNGYVEMIQESRNLDARVLNRTVSQSSRGLGKVGSTTIQRSSDYVLCRVYTCNLTLVNIAVSIRYTIEVGVACRNIGPWSNNLRLPPCIKVCKIARTLVCPHEITRKLEFRHVCAVTYCVFALSRMSPNID